jgi:HK97 gp10 family phage protein
MSDVQRNAVILTLAEVLPQIKQDAKSFAPYKTGKLKRSIKTKIDRIKLAGSVYTEVRYSHLVEFGTNIMAPRPYLRPAIDRNRKEVYRVFRRELSRQWRKP